MSQDEKISARIDAALLRRLDAAAAQDRRSRSSAIEVAVAEWVQRSEARQAGVAS